MRKLTARENIADHGGVSIAYDAFQRTQQAKEQKLIDGLPLINDFLLVLLNRGKLK